MNTQLPKLERDIMMSKAHEIAKYFATQHTKPAKQEEDMIDGSCIPAEIAELSSTQSIVEQQQLK